MKANEFFKAMGINAVRQFLENDNIRTKEMHDDLKRLIESHDLVDGLGGLDEARDLLVKVSARDHKYAQNFEKPALIRAIADVESCMEVNQ